MVFMALVTQQPGTPAEPGERTVAVLPADPLLARLISESLSAVPELSRAEATVRAELERVPQAGAWPDPMLEVGVQNMGFTSLEIGHDPMSYASVMGSQTVPWPGKPRLRRELAELDAAQAREAVTRVRLTTEADVRRAYVEALLVRDRLALLERLETLWQKSLGVARARYEAGEGAQSDVLRSQLELNRIKLRRFGLRAGERRAVQALNRLRGRPLDERLETLLHVRELPAPRSLAGLFSVERALAETPELALARLSVARADKAASLAETSSLPDLTVGAGVMVRGPVPPMWVLTVGGPLPVFSATKQTRQVAETRARVGAARAGLSETEQRVRLRSEDRRAAHDALLETIDLYDEGLLAQSAATTESTLAQYQVGKVSFAAVLEANAGFIADEEGHLEALAAAHRLLIAEAELSLAEVAEPAGAGGSEGAGGSGQGGETGSGAERGGGSMSSM